MLAPGRPAAEEVGQCDVHERAEGRELGFHALN